ncbi:MAG: tripartite tricarboxylate transporter substrate binding protein [Comamonas sp.]
MPMLSTAQTANFPTKPVRIITPFPVGGGPDGVARLTADKLSRLWGQPVTVENRPGGNGFIAIEAWKRGAKDGTDLLILDNVHLAAYPTLFKKLPYNAEKDFTIVQPLFKTHFFFTVATNSKFKSVGEIIAAAKANPGKLNFGSWSVGNPVHLGSEMFKNMTGTQMEHVIFKETTQLYTSVATGDIDFALGSAGTAGPMYHAGKLRLVAFAAPQRSPDFPDIPTVAESGGPKDFEVIGWNVVSAPPTASPAVVEKIRKDLIEILKDKDFAEKYKTFGYEPFPTTPEQFKATLKAETQRFSDVIRKANISLD